jgi:hypothetical protein
MEAHSARPHLFSLILNLIWDKLNYQEMVSKLGERGV